MLWQKTERALHNIMYMVNVEVHAGPAGVDPGLSKGGVRLSSRYYTLLVAPFNKPTIKYYLENVYTYIYIPGSDLALVMEGDRT